MKYYLGIIRFKVFSDDPKETQSELMQLICASNKDEAYIALRKYWEENSNSYSLTELRINDTVFGA